MLLYCSTTSFRITFLLSIFIILSSTVNASYPYIPTFAFQSVKKKNHPLYVLEPPSTNASRGQLLAISANSPLNTTSPLPTSVVSSTLPFLLQDPSIAYVPVLAPDGTLVVYAGNCSQNVQGSAVWTYTPDDTGSGGTWENTNPTEVNATSNIPLTGANYLAAGVAFSNSTAGAASRLYVFGGLCPTSGITSSALTTTGNFSDNLLVYNAGQISVAPFEQGQPIAQAGSTMTPLLPQFTNISQSTIQEQNFLLFGGTTETAFVDTSMVAILSLPQESWSFETVKTSGAQSIEPRSGHSATLTSDGSKLVVIGGWVGDVDIPATPQVIILNIGAGYGGSGDWTWTVPSNTTPFGTAGLYGHGAVLLTGDVIMVTGGYSTNHAGIKQRQVDSTENAGTQFYNVTSASWISSYTPVQTDSTNPTASETPGMMGTMGTRIGLGAGLGVGLAVLIIVIAVIWYFQRRRKNKEQKRDDMVRFANMSNTEYQGYNEDADEKDSGLDWEKQMNPEDDDAIVPATSLWKRKPRNKASWTWLPNGEDKEENNGVWANTGVREAQRTGLDVDVPSPHRGLRRSHFASSLRPSYHPRAAYEDDPPNGYDTMYAISERSEESSMHGSRNVSANNAMAAQPYSDPFLDPQPDLGESHQHRVVLQSPLRQNSHSASVIMPQSRVQQSPRQSHEAISSRQQNHNGMVVDQPRVLNQYSPARSDRSSLPSSPRASYEVGGGSARPSLQQDSPLSFTAFPQPRRDSPHRLPQHYSVEYMERPAPSSTFKGIPTGTPCESSKISSGVPDLVPYENRNARGVALGPGSTDHDPSAMTSVEHLQMPTHPSSPDSESFKIAHTYTTEIISPFNTPPLSPQVHPGTAFPDHDSSTFQSLLEPDTRPTFTRPASPQRRRSSRSGSRGSSRSLGLFGSVRRTMGPRSMSYNERREHRANGTSPDRPSSADRVTATTQPDSWQTSTLLTPPRNAAIGASYARRVASEGGMRSPPWRGRRHYPEPSTGPIPLLLPQAAISDETDISTPTTVRRISTRTSLPDGSPERLKRLQRPVPNKRRRTSSSQSSEDHALHSSGASSPVLTRQQGPVLNGYVRQPLPAHRPAQAQEFLQSPSGHADRYPQFSAPNPARSSLPSNIQRSQIPNSTNRVAAFNTHAYGSSQGQHNATILPSFRQTQTQRTAPFQQPQPPQRIRSTHQHHANHTRNQRSISITSTTPSHWTIGSGSAMGSAALSDVSSWSEERQGVPVTLSFVPRGGLVLRDLSAGREREQSSDVATVGGGAAPSEVVDRSGSRIMVDPHVIHPVDAGSGSYTSTGATTTSATATTTVEMPSPRVVRGAMRVVGDNGEGEWLRGRINSVGGADIADSWRRSSGV